MTEQGRRMDLMPEHRLRNASRLNMIPTIHLVGRAASQLKSILWEQQIQLCILHTSKVNRLWILTAQTGILVYKTMRTRFNTYLTSTWLWPWDTALPVVPAHFWSRDLAQRHIALGVEEAADLDSEPRNEKLELKENYNTFPVGLFQTGTGMAQWLDTLKSPKFDNQCRY